MRLTIALAVITAFVAGGGSALPADGIPISGMLEQSRRMREELQRMKEEYKAAKATVTIVSSAESIKALEDQAAKVGSEIDSLKRVDASDNSAAGDVKKHTEAITMTQTTASAGAGVETGVGVKGSETVDGGVDVGDKDIFGVEGFKINSSIDPISDGGGGGAIPELGSSHPFAGKRFVNSINGRQSSLTNIGSSYLTSSGSSSSGSGFSASRHTIPSSKEPDIADLDVDELPNVEAPEESEDDD